MQKSMSMVLKHQFSRDGKESEVICSLCGDVDDDYILECQNHGTMFSLTVCSDCLLKLRNFMRINASSPIIGDVAVDLDAVKVSPLVKVDKIET